MSKITDVVTDYSLQLKLLTAHLLLIYISLSFKVFNTAIFQAMVQRAKGGSLHILYTNNGSHIRFFEHMIKNTLLQGFLWLFHMEWYTMMYFFKFYLETNILSCLFLCPSSRQPKSVFFVKFWRMFFPPGHDLRFCDNVLVFFRKLSDSFYRVFFFYSWESQLYIILYNIKTDHFWSSVFQIL